MPSSAAFALGISSMPFLCHSGGSQEQLLLDVTVPADTNGVFSPCVLLLLTLSYSYNSYCYYSTNSVCDYARVICIITYARYLGLALWISFRLLFLLLNLLYF